MPTLGDRFKLHGAACFSGGRQPASHSVRGRAREWRRCELLVSPNISRALFFSQAHARPDKSNLTHTLMN